MANYTDAELGELARYGGPRDPLARHLLSDLQTARSQVRNLEASLARPQVAVAVAEADRQGLLQRQAAERTAAGIAQ